MRSDFIPVGDAAKIAFLQNLATVVNADPATYGVSGPQNTAFQTNVTAAVSAFNALPALLAAAHAGTETKNTTIAAAVAGARGINASAQADPDVTDAELTTAGLPVHDSTRSPIPPPATEPIIYLSNGGHTKILVVLHDSGSPDAHSHAKPDGVAGIELWVQKNGTPPVDNSTMMSLGDFSKTRFTLTFDPTDVGKTLYFMGRWVNPTGEKGAWSVVASMVLS